MEGLGLYSVPLCVSRFDLCLAVCSLTIHVAIYFCSSVPWLSTEVNNIPDVSISFTVSLFVFVYLGVPSRALC